MLCCALTACNKVTVDFSYGPENPRAGALVTFSNLSSSGEEWEWTFGDGSTATIKSPTHTYKRPGTYRVILKVDKKNALTATKEITVFDTVPTFVWEDSVFCIYQDYTFTANVYNPYNYEVKYEWSFPLNTVYTALSDEDASLNGSSLKIYFTKPLDKAPVWLHVIMNGDTTFVEKSFAVQDRQTNSLLMRTAGGDCRQRIFGVRAEEYKPVAKNDLLDNEQDTEQTYNGKLFKLADLAATFPGILGFHIANRKIYYRADGLWVANLDGSNAVQIDAEPCVYMTLDTRDSRVYWANAKGVWYMPFVGSDNNKFVTTPIRLNDLTTVAKLAPDYELK